MSRHVVRLFARYAELFGAEQVEVVVPEGASVTDLIAALRELPGGASLPTVPFVAVNMRQAKPESALARGDEIALLPPLAGG